ncbi:MAG: hypothetical protein IPK58_22130 [Acidobacteria bacterium]|nr:hypothetical protein [Acidobacteriota bacterium]
MGENDQLVLFELGKAAKPVNRCRQCRFSFRHDWNKSWMYCEKQSSTRTLNGFEKIKPMDAACRAFEQKESDK